MNWKRVLGLSDCMITAADDPFEVRIQHVDLACTQHFGGRTAAFGLKYGVRMAVINETSICRQALGAAGRTFARQQYNWDRIVVRLTEEYKAAIARGSGEAGLA